MNKIVLNKAEQIAEDFLQEKAKDSYEILGKGIVNEVCVVETDNNKVVIRMNSKDTYPTFLKEKWCIEQALAAGIPSPEVLFVGIFGETAYMIQTFVDGENGLDTEKDRVEIWKQVGVYLQMIHAIPVKGFGENLDDAGQGVFYTPPHTGSDGSWLGYVNYNINSLTEHDQLIELGVINKTESKRVRELFENIKNEKFKFGLNHGDISLKNTIVSEEGQLSLLDWGSAQVSVVPHEDIIEIWKCQMLGGGPTSQEWSAFLEGYGLKEEDLTNMKPFMLLRAFDKLRWAIDQSPDLIEPFAKFARRVVEMTLD